MDTFVVLEYIKSAIEIILNLKFEEIEGRLRETNPDNVGGQEIVVDSKSSMSKSLANCENVFSPRVANQFLSGTSSP